MAQAGAMGNVGVAVAASFLLYHLKVKQTFYAIAAKQVAMLKYINSYHIAPHSKAYVNRAMTTDS